MNFNFKLKGLLMTLLTFLFVFTGNIQAQDKLKKMPGYKQYREMAPKLYRSVKKAPTSVVWAKDGKTFTFVQDGKAQTFDVKKRKVVSSATPPKRQPRFRRGNRPARGRQYASATSPDKKLKAYTKNRNMYIIFIYI